MLGYDTRSMPSMKGAHKEKKLGELDIKFYKMDWLIGGKSKLSIHNYLL